MEDLVRYFIIGIGVIYFIYKTKEMIFNKNYGCKTCSMNKSCAKKSCEITDIKLSDKDVESIKKIKLDFIQ